MTDNYKELYLFLFNRVTDALESLEAGRPGDARRVLEAAQRETEERYVAQYAAAGIEE